MRRSISVVMFFALLALSIVFATFAYDDISPAEVKQKLDAAEDIFIIDVRELEEYAQGYVPTAYLMPERRLP